MSSFGEKIGDFRHASNVEFGSKLFLAASSGILVHLLIFIKGEWHMKTLTIFWLHILVFGVVALEESLTTKNYLWCTYYIATTYLAALSTSITIYRLFFHPLSSRAIPGPLLARISKFWHVSQCVTSKNHLLLTKLQEQYGDVVRTGPNEVTIYDPAIFTAIDGPGNKCTKPAWYDLLQPTVALNTTRDRIDHDDRRKVWNRGLNPEALRNYKGRINRYTDLLDDYVASHVGEPISANDIFYWFTFDIMGDLAYGTSFGMLSEHKWHYAISWMNEFMELVGPISPVPWLGRFLFHVPGVTPKWHRFMDWCQNRLKDRLAMEPDEPDVSSWLIDHIRSDGAIGKTQFDTLHGDLVTMTVAGSDTSAQTLLFLFYHLAQDPKRQSELRQEILKSNAQSPDAAAFGDCQYLDAFINETLRIHPPVPTGAIRQAGPEGIDIAGVHIPAYTIIVAPRYCIARREDCFEKADQFIPERWTSAPHLAKRKEAFSPFVTGRYSCVGKGLAFLQIRSLVAQLVTKYSVSFVDGSDPDACWRDFRDNFTGLPGKLDLIFQPVKA